MDANAMFILCKRTKADLERLECLVHHIPDPASVSEFIYRSMNDVRELAQIARWETSHHVTVEQTAHIHRIASRTHHFMKAIPNNVRRQPGDDIM